MAQRQSSVYKDIANEIILQITSGKYKDGDLLPSEMALSQKYGVQRTTVRRALSLLEGKYITKLAGKGSVVGTNFKETSKPDTNVLKNSNNALIFILPEITGFVPEYLTSISKHLESICRDDGIKFITTTSPTISQLSQIISGYSVLGAVVCKDADDKTIEYLKEQNIHVCLLLCQKHGFRSVCIDKAKTMQHTVNSLCNLGHTDIYFIGTSNDIDLKDSFTGALNQSTAKENPDCAMLGYGFDNEKIGYDLFNLIYRSKRGSFAVCCANEKIALGVINSAQNLGLSIPGDISVTAFWGSNPGISHTHFDCLAISHQVFSEIKLQNICQNLSDNVCTYFYGELCNDSTISCPKENTKSSRSSISDFLL